MTRLMPAALARLAVASIVTVTVTAGPATAGTRAAPEPATTELPEPTTEIAGGGDQPAQLPVGAAWTEVPLDGHAAGAWVGLVHAQQHWWVLALRGNTARVLRSADGETFTEILLAAPPDSGTLTVQGLLERGDGALVAYGARGSDCNEGTPDADGFRHGTQCRRARPVVYLSGDGGDSWHAGEPDSLAPPSGDVSLRLAGIVHDGAQFVAAGTVTGPDWHVRLYTSPDGEQWTLRQELRDPRGPLAATRLLFDGTTFLLHAQASPCSVPYVSTPGWVRDSYWAEHDVVYVGADLDGLAVLTPEIAAVVPAPMEADCAATSGLDLSNLPYPSVRAELAAGHLTLLDTSTAEAGGNPTVHRLARLVGGEWQQLTLDRGVGSDGEPLEPSRAAPQLTEIDGRLTVVELQRDPLRRAGAVAPHLYVHVEGDSWDVVATVNPVIAAEFTQIVWHDGALAAAALVPAPDAGLGPADLPTLWRSAATGDDPRHCVLATAASCRGAVLTIGGADLDLTGRDLSEIDLSYAQLDVAVLDQATLRGANLYAARTVPGASLANTDLAGADLRRAQLHGLVGVDLTGADARHAVLGFTGSPGALDGALLGGALLGFGGWKDTAREVSLAGLDLTDVTVSGLAADTPPLRITDVSGATLTNTGLYGVDLSGLDIAPEALAGLRIDDASLCPDGLPPTGDPPTPTCVREG